MRSMHAVLKAAKAGKSADTTKGCCPFHVAKTKKRGRFIRRDKRPDR